MLGKTKFGKNLIMLKKSRIWETKNLLTYADSRTNTILEMLCDLSTQKNLKSLKQFFCKIFERMFLQNL